LLEHETIDGAEVTRLIDLARNGAAPQPAEPAPVPDRAAVGDND
jgi:hypothetical protein